MAWLAGRKLWIAAGTSGADVSIDGGQNWKQFDPGNCNAVSFFGKTGWATGPRGRIAVFTIE